MTTKRSKSNPPRWQPIKLNKRLGNPVSKMTQVAGRRIAGALRAEQARQQKRRDTKR
jgi:hypothetical protein